MYDGLGHFEPEDDYYDPADDPRYAETPEEEERNRWPTEDQAPPEVPDFAPIPLPEKRRASLRSAGDTATTLDRKPLYLCGSTPLQAVPTSGDGSG
ncbi:hypothetical protein [Synechococcus elongatus]|uniref:ANL08 n=1 Tax=Synechococcus elongatus (strain ATCC 33912 / PCC 7942 / FACHB-805) TaxID=1140 RepID=Q8KUW5_SYNE7|nr:hypothetical protein [Synechococcus elongatus]AAM81139.1 ANL08 [Synechococcus elongatus PCC 7942 = FACHB-805]ABB58665.1 hypothetical protein Synpcc7942_B2636 [Synechococcus elongatus PCC 7942 = FACHB-805]MBD2589041.1 hypothetical protein [Synechococcus elongatus FACHB-242]MBD2690138.1 hypothetical protein [Synechococcus elongatus FACHB-1061]MBD2708568.1 hypothetical protein [Synechococcus elongatus PCC 7942 = FACHB-805]